MQKEMTAPRLTNKRVLLINPVTMQATASGPRALVVDNYWNKRGNLIAQLMEYKMSKPKEKNFSYVSLKKYDGMMGRCYRPTDTSYSNYGAKGIRVAKEWIINIEQFRAWLLEELSRMDISVEQFINNSSKYQLDRIARDGHYSPTNCRLVSPQVNMRNRWSCKMNTIISAEGETICIDTIS